MSVYIKLRGKKSSLTLGNDGDGLFFSFWNDVREIEYSAKRGWTHKRWKLGDLPF